MPGDDEVGLALDLGRPLVGGDADADRVLELARRAPARAGPRRRRGRCGRRRRTAPRVDAAPRAISRRTAIPLCDLGERPQLEHHPAEVRDQPLLRGELGELAAARCCGRRRRRRRRASGSPGSGPCPRAAGRRSSSARQSSRETKPAAARAAVAERRVEARARVARRQQLEPVVAGVGELVEADHAARGARPAAADAGDQPVAAGELAQQLARLRRARRRPPGRRRSAPGCRRCRRGSPPRPGRRAAARGSGRRAIGALVSRRDGARPDSSSWPRSQPPPGPSAACSGSAAARVIVPLLILWFAYGEREATGTSLAAIVVIALLAAIGQGALRQRRPARGAARRGARGRRGGRRHRAAAARPRARDLAAVRRSCWSRSRSSC